MIQRSFACVLVLGLALTGTAFADATVDEGPAHTTFLSHQEVTDALDAGDLTLRVARALGLAVFSTPFNTYDGHGDGPFDPAETDTAAFGHRPTLQGNGLSLRVNGLDAQSCNECHTIVSNRTRPPTLGFGGVGGIVQNAIIMPTLIDVADSFDDRVAFQSGHDPSLSMVFDGVADYNGRFANPPFLFGGGGVELLGKEMTRDLQDLLDIAQTSAAGTVTSLDTHGVNFGSITTLDNLGNVQLDVEGIGPEDISGLAPDSVLVVRPFGRKGENFTMRDFDRGAMQFHFGIQPQEVIGAGQDEDGDGVSDEVEDGEMTLLHIFDVLNPRPRQEHFTWETYAGFQTFQDIGCDGCQIPAIETNSRHLKMSFPDVAEDPDANVYTSIALREAGFDRVPGGGLVIPLFADLKRHKMGPGLAETFERGDLANDEFTTARLWGIADTAPYLHDGRATTLYQAIDMHGGEAQAVRDSFTALTNDEQADLLAFLRSLRVPHQPNQNLVPILRYILQ